MVETGGGFTTCRLNIVVAMHVSHGGYFLHHIMLAERRWRKRRKGMQHPSENKGGKCATQRRMRETQISYI